MAGKSVLPTIGLTLDEQRLLGDAVGRIGLPGYPLHRSSSWNGTAVFRVRTDGPYGQEPSHAAQSGMLHQLHAHHEILVEELSGTGAIRADPDDVEVHHHVRRVSRNRRATESSRTRSGSADRGTST